MKKKIFIVLLTVFVVFIGTLYFFHKKERKIKNYLSEIEKTETNIELNELKDIDIDSINDENKSIDSGNNLTGNQEKMIEEMVANQLADINIISTLNVKGSEKRYQRIFFQEMKKDNYYLAIKAIKRILKTTKHKDIWYKKIVDLYIKIGDFNFAEEYIKKLLKIQPTKENLHTYLYIKFQNVNFFDDEQVKNITDFINVLYKKKVITASEFTFYNFLIQLLTQWKIENMDVLLNDLLQVIDNPEQKNLILSIKSDLKVYKEKKGSPLYYFKALVALDLLKFGYFGLSKNLAEQIYIEDSSYILPQQILAHSYFFMGKYDQAIKYFKKLQNLDSSNLKDYTFYIGVSYFWKKKYDNALLFLSQLDNKYPYYLDVLRYKIISYLKLKDYDNAIENIKLLLNYKLSYIDYYNLFKFLLFKCEDCYKKDTKLLVKLVKNCYAEVDKEHQYVCWYGKANLYYKFGKIKVSIKYYKLLTKYFQDAYIYEILANYYNKKGNKKLAKYYYLKELLYTDDFDKRKIIKNKIKNLILDKK